MVVEEVKALYALPPGDFVAERTLLVRRLKQDQRKVDAAAIARLRRPKAAEYLLNHLSREHPDVVAAWTAAVDVAREAQSAAIGGASGDDLRAATASVNAVTKATIDAAVQLDATVKGDDLVTVLRTLIAADSTGMLTSGVVGSEGVLAPADLFAGAPDPPERPVRTQPTASPRTRAKPAGEDSPAATPRRASGSQSEPATVPALVREPEPEPEPVRRPSAAEIRRRTKLIADYQRSQSALQAAHASAAAAQSRVDSAAEALAKAEAATALRQSELAEAEATAQRLAAEVADLDPPA